jgi:hypothetical protein
MQRSRWTMTTAAIRRRDFALLFSRSAEAISGIGQEVSVEITIEATASSNITKSNPRN